MKECNYGRIPPCYGSLEYAIYEEAKKVNEEWKKTRARHYKLIDKLRAKLMEGGFMDDTHDKVYEVNRQMCDIGKTMNDPIKPFSEEAAQEIAKALEITRKPKDIMEEKKTKKMTKAEAFEWLKCKKVDTIGLGEEVQKKLFDCGVKWANGKTEYYDFSDYLLIESNGDLYHCGNCGEAYWRMHHFDEIYAQDILSLEIEEECAKDDEDPYFGGRIKDLQEMIKDEEVLIITKTNFLTMTK